MSRGNVVYRMGGDSIQL